MNLFQLALRWSRSLSERSHSRLFPSTFLRCFSLFILCSPAVQAQWTYVPGPPAGQVGRLLSTPEAIYATTVVGVYKSTDGSNWQLLPTQHDPSSKAHFVAAEGNTILISFYYPNAPSKGDLFYSSDAGVSFKKIRQDILTNPNWWYDRTIAIQNDTIYGIIEYNHYNLVRSTDGGQSWDTLSYWQNLTFNLHVRPNGELLAFSNGTLIQSVDGGANWTDVLFIGTGHLRRVGNYWFVTTSGNKIFRFVDDLSTYDVRNVPFGDYTTIRYWTIDDRMYGAIAGLPGGSTNVGVSLNDGISWNSCVLCGSWDYRCTDFTAFNGKTYAASDHGLYTIDTSTHLTYRTGNGVQAADISAIGYGGNNDWYVGTQQGFFRSVDNTVSWTEQKWAQLQPHTKGIETLYASGNNVLGFNGSYSRSSDKGITWNFVPSLFGASKSNWASDLDKGLLFVGGKRKIYRSTDLGATLDSIPLPQPGAFPESFVSSVDYRDGILVVATDSSELFYAADQGLNWQEFGQGLPQTPDYRPMLWASRHGNNILAMAGEHLMRFSIDAQLWEESTLIIPNNVYPQMSKPVSWKGLLFAAVPEQGVYVTADLGVHWSKINLPADDRFVRTLQVIDQKLTVGVVGGMWQRENFDYQYFSGNIWADQNLNGTQDIGEVQVPEVVVTALKSKQFTRSDGNGNYQLLLEKGQPDTLVAIAPTPECTVSPAKYVVTQPDSVYHFGLYFNPDWSVTVTNAQWPRIGFETDFVLTCQNLGPTDATGLAKFVASPWFEILEALPGPSMTVGDTLFWLLPPTATLQTQNIKIKTRLSSNTPILDELPVHAWVAFTDGTLDSAPDNNYAFWNKYASGSYDPNNKSVLPEGAITPGMIADSQRLVYIVRFQNVGNAPATFVRISDTLDAGLDAGSFRLLSASHPVNWNFRNGRILEFYFDNIQLPDSTSDEPNSHGFVTFSILANQGLLPGEVLSNRAGIYFDFNPVELTNIVETPVDNVNQLKNRPAPFFNLNIAPNPATNLVQISWHAPDNSTPVLVSLIDIKGDYIKNSMVENTSVCTINIQDLPSGVYFVKIGSGTIYGASILIKQ